MSRARLANWALSAGVVLALCCNMGCGDASPSAPSLGSPQPQPSPALTISGRIVGTVTNEPIPGATLTIGGTRVTTDAGGGFTFDTTQSGAVGVSISGSGLVTRATSIGHATVTVDVIQNKEPFDLDFFRAIARNGFEQPAALQAIQRLTEAPRIYIRTIDDAGQAIDAATLDTVESALLDVADTWSGGRFGLAGIARGTETREGLSGWVTVRWSNPSTGNTCGSASLGTTGGALNLNYLGPCSCGGPSRIDATIARHELGHIFGYWHTGNPSDLMSGVFSTCGQRPSAREVAHAKYFYARPVGNTDPDTDPRSTVFSQPRAIVIRD